MTIECDNDNNYVLNKEEILEKSILPKFVPKAVKERRIPRLKKLKETDIFEHDQEKGIEYSKLIFDEEANQFVERENKIYYVLKTIEKTLNEFLELP